MKRLIGYTPTPNRSRNNETIDKKTPNFTNGSHNTANETNTLTIANEIISNNFIEFQSMYIGRDPRLPDYEWITEDDVRQIHRNIIDKVGGKYGIHNAFDLRYAIEHPMTNIVGIDKDVYYRICECSHLLARIFVDCGAQVSATVFLTLCKKNHIKVSFKLGEIYDIFSNLVGPIMDFDTFYTKMKDHLIPTRKITQCASSSGNGAANVATYGSNSKDEIDYLYDLIEKDPKLLDTDPLVPQMLEKGTYQYKNY